MDHYNPFEVNFLTPVYRDSPRDSRNKEQTVEPDVVFIRNGYGVNSCKFWMAVTPYANTAIWENPSIYESNDGINWQCPPGINNPLVGKPEVDGAANGDPGIVYNPNNGVLRVYFCEGLRRSGDAAPSNRDAYIYCVETNNGARNWTRFVYPADRRRADSPYWETPPSPDPCLRDETDARLQSPSVYIANGNYWLYYCNWDVSNAPGSDDGLRVIRYRSTDGITFSAADRKEVTFNPAFTPDRFPGATPRYPYHLNCRADVGDPNRIHMLLVTATSRGGEESDLEYCYSTDLGDSFTVVQKLFSGSRNGYDNSYRYRAGFIQCPDAPKLFGIWYTGWNRANGEWRTVYVPAVLEDNTLWTSMTNSRLFGLRDGAVQEIDPVGGAAEVIRSSDELAVYGAPTALGITCDRIYTATPSGLKAYWPVDSREMSTAAWSNLTSISAMASMFVPATPANREFATMYIVNGANLVQILDEAAPQQIHDGYAGTRSMTTIGSIIYSITNDCLIRFDTTDEGSPPEIVSNAHGDTLSVISIANRLYGINNNNLIEINPADGVSTVVASGWYNFKTMTVLADRLFVVKEEGGTLRLSRFDPVTGDTELLSGEWRKDSPVLITSLPVKGKSPLAIR